MPLQEEFEQTGDRFFRWRSYLPLVMAGLFVLALITLRAQGGVRDTDQSWELGCLLISLLGQGIRFYTVGFVPHGTSGRNTRGQVAETLNTTGMYAVVRNPLYLGNFIIWLGLALVLKSWWFTTLIVLFFTLFYERIIFAEERFLREKFGGDFMQWAGDTPAMIPRLRKWRPPDLSFSWKAALNREYGTFFAIISSFTVLNFLRHLLLGGSFRVDGLWLKIFVAGAAFYGAVRLLKKKTRLLATVGR